MATTPQSVNELPPAGASPKERAPRPSKCVDTYCNSASYFTAMQLAKSRVMRQQLLGATPATANSNVCSATQPAAASSNARSATQRAVQALTVAQNDLRALREALVAAEMRADDAAADAAASREAASAVQARISELEYSLADAESRAGVLQTVNQEESRARRLADEHAKHLMTRLTTTEASAEKLMNHHAAATRELRVAEVRIGRLESEAVAQRVLAQAAVDDAASKVCSLQDALPPMTVDMGEGDDVGTSVSSGGEATAQRQVYLMRIRQAELELELERVSARARQAEECNAELQMAVEANRDASQEAELMQRALEEQVTITLGHYRQRLEELEAEISAAQRERDELRHALEQKDADRAAQTPAAEGLWSSLSLSAQAPTLVAKPSLEELPQDVACTRRRSAEGKASDHDDNDDEHGFDAFNFWRVPPLTIQQIEKAPGASRQRIRVLTAPVALLNEPPEQPSSEAMGAQPPSVNASTLKSASRACHHAAVPASTSVSPTIRIQLGLAPMLPAQHDTVPRSGWGAPRFDSRGVGEGRQEAVGWTGRWSKLARPNEAWISHRSQMDL